MSVAPCCFYPDARQMCVAGFANAASTHALAARVFPQRRTRVTHQLSRPCKDSKLSYDGHGAHPGNASQAPQRLDHRMHLHGQRLGRRIDRVLEARNTLGRVLDFVPMIFQCHLLRGLLEALSLDPQEVRVLPVRMFDAGDPARYGGP